MSLRRERHYQYIRYLKGGYSLKEINRLMTVASTASTNRHMNSKDKKDLLQLDGALSKIVMTRQQAVDAAMVKFFPRKAQRKEELIGQMLTGYKSILPHKYTREPALRRKPGTKPAKPQIGSSKKVIGKTRVSGASRVLKDFKLLIRTLNRLGQKHGRGNPNMAKHYRQFRLQVQSYTK